MKIKWLGHASFLLTATDGTRVVTDPYSGEIGFDFPAVSADVVTVSHDHYDHNNSKAVSGAPVVFSSVGNFQRENVRLQGIPTYHDEVEGAKRGPNVAFIIELDGIKICHLGDLGQPENDELVRAAKGVDILLIPVGGTYTLDGKTAADYVGKIQPKIIIPMHFKTPDLCIEIDGIAEFEKAIKGAEITHLGAETLPISRAILDGIDGVKVIVLDKRIPTSKRR